MTEPWADPRLVANMRNLGLEANQVAFMQACLIAGSNARILAQSGLSRETAALAVPWAVTLIEEHRRTGQPYAGPTRKGVEWALNAFNLLPLSTGHLQVASGWVNSLNNVLAPGNLGAAPVPSIDSPTLQTHYRQCFEAGLHAAHIGSTPWEQVDRLATEVGIGLLASGRQVQALCLSLRAAKKSADLINIVVPIPVPHQVLVGVQGVKELVGLDEYANEIKLRLLPREQWRRRFPGWGGAGDRAAKVAALLTDINILLPGGEKKNVGADSLMTAEVCAVDHRSAAVLAKRRVSEALDHFAAADPHARIRLLDLVAVTDSDSNFVSVQDTRPPTARELQPLPSEIPSGLRLGIRAAMLVRSAESPMNRAAMAWVALESAGLNKAEATEWAAKALSLHLLRQRIFLAYRMLATDAPNVGEAERYRRYAETARRRARRYSHPAPVGAPEGYRVARERGVALAHLKAALMQVLAREHDGLETKRRALLKELALEGTHHAGTGFLRKTSAWLEALQALGRGEEEATELSLLVENCSPVTKANVGALSTLICTGDAITSELNNERQWCEGLLRLLYAARNMHLHAGRHSSEGDMALDHLGLLLPDALFEIWTTWYLDPAQKNKTCEQVLKELAQRYDTLIELLADGSGPGDLDLSSLTGPSWMPEQIQRGAG